MPMKKWLMIIPGKLHREAPQDMKKSPIPRTSRPVTMVMRYPHRLTRGPAMNSVPGM